MDLRLTKAGTTRAQLLLPTKGTRELEATKGSKEATRVATKAGITKETRARAATVVVTTKAVPRPHVEVAVSKATPSEEVVVADTRVGGAAEEEVVTRVGTRELVEEELVVSREEAEEEQEDTRADEEAIRELEDEGVSTTTEEVEIGVEEEDLEAAEEAGTKYPRLHLAPDCFLRHFYPITDTQSDSAKLIRSADICMLKFLTRIGRMSLQQLLKCLNIL